MAKRTIINTITAAGNDSNYFKVSQSKVKTWRECRRRYHNKYVLMLRKKTRARPLMFGSIVHEIIEADANGDDWALKLKNIDLTNQKLFKAEREMYGEIIADIECIMTDYFEYWAEQNKELVFSRKFKKSAEFPFEIEIAPGILFKGKIDAVVKYNGMRALGEHKTFKRMPNAEFRWKAVQSAVYIRAIEIQGWWNDLEGTLWNYVHNRTPDVPKLTTKGVLSAAKLHSVPSRVEAYIKAAGQKPRDHKVLLEKVRADRENWFVRVFTPMNELVIEDTWSDFVETAIEMSKLHGLSKTRNVGQHCGWCDFEPLCRAEVTGMDVDFILERTYTREPEDPLDMIEDEE